MNDSFQFTKKHFETTFYGDIGILTSADDETLKAFCPTFIDDIVMQHDLMSMFFMFVLINTLGMFTQVVQKMVIFRIKDNVTLNYPQLFLETSIAVVGILFVILWTTATH